MSNNVNVSVKVSELIKIIETQIAKAKTEHAERVRKHKLAVTQYKRDHAAWLKNVAKLVRAQAEKIEKGNAGAIDDYYYGNRDAYVKVLVPQPPKHPGTEPILQTNGMLGDVKLLKLSADDTLRITANSNFARYF